MGQRMLSICGMALQLPFYFAYRKERGRPLRGGHFLVQGMQYCLPCLEEPSYFFSTSILRVFGLASSRFGMVRVSWPSLYSALTCSVSMELLCECCAGSGGHHEQARSRSDGRSNLRLAPSLIPRRSGCAAQHDIRPLVCHAVIFSPPASRRRADISDSRRLSTRP